MRKLLYAVAGAAALSTASLANAAIMIGNTSGGNIVVGTPDNVTMPETVKFDTDDQHGRDASFPGSNSRMT